MEEYKVCFEGVYEISNLGNCRRRMRNGEYRTVVGSINNRGYRYFQVKRDGKRVNNLFHHAVADCFIGDRPDGLVIDHIDRDKLNNKVENLRYVTQKENMRNTHIYRVDILETDPRLRSNTHSKARNALIRESKKHHCSLCDLSFNSAKKLQRHIDGYRHCLKSRYRTEMEKNNIEWSLEEYKRRQYAVWDFNNGKRVTKPLVYV